jgi:hypothetical protein
MCVISTHSTEVSETLAVATLPLSPRSSPGEQGFLDQEGFRREDLGLMETLASLSPTSAQLFASSEPQLPCLPGGDIRMGISGVGIKKPCRPSLAHATTGWALSQCCASGTIPVLSGCDGEPCQSQEPCPSRKTLSPPVLQLPAMLTVNNKVMIYTYFLVTQSHSVGTSTQVHA